MGLSGDLGTCELSRSMVAVGQYNESRMERMVAHEAQIGCFLIRCGVQDQRRAALL